MIKRSVTIQGHRTSIALEQPFWECLRRIATSKSQSVSRLIAEIDTKRTTQLSKGEKTGGLSSAIRIYILEWALSSTSPLD